jgi:carbon storage regulator
MLVLSRRETEVIHIGDNIEIVVLEIDRGRVRIGINCPRDIPVNRREVYLELKRQEQVRRDQAGDGGK